MDTDTSEDAGGPAILSGNEVMEAQFKVHDATAVSNLKCNTLTEGNVRKWERDTSTCSQKTE